MAVGNRTSTSRNNRVLAIVRRLSYRAKDAHEWLFLSEIVEAAKAPGTLELTEDDAKKALNYLSKSTKTYPTPPLETFLVSGEPEAKRTWRLRPETKAKEVKGIRERTTDRKD